MYPNIPFTCMGPDFSSGGGWQYSLRPYQLLLYRSFMGFHLRYDNIGIKHDFLCINICWAPIVVLKHECVKLGF